MVKDKKEMNMGLFNQTGRRFIAFIVVTAIIIASF